MAEAPDTDPVAHRDRERPGAPGPRPGADAPREPRPRGTRVRELRRRVRKRLRPRTRMRRGFQRLHPLLRLAALAAVRLLLLPRRAPRPGERLRVRVLLQHAYGTGGTIRTVLNLSGYLARDHDVEIVSVFRRRDEPFFTLSPRVRVRFVDDRRTPPKGAAGRLLSRLPSLLTPIEDASFESMSLWTDLLLVRVLCGPSPDVLIGTRPSLNMLAAELAPRGVVAIGQDHMNLSAYMPGLRREIRRSYPRLAAVSVLTERSRRDYGDELEGGPARIVRIPNALPELPGGPSPREDKVIVAAGRLTRQKGFDLLVRAYEPLAAEHPDWKLRIFGAGPRRNRIKKMIAERGLAGRVELCGRTPDLAGEMTRASMYVLSSRFEGMPMVIIEAMSKGLPVVAFDCPTGPGEMIEHGRNGLLVPAEDVAGLTAALRTLIGDRALRDRLGEGALVSSREYDLDRVGPQWLRLLDELRPPAPRPAAGRARPAPARPRRRPARRRVLVACVLAGLALWALGLLTADS
ncbi:hypothetical protein GCM10023085_71970 [Actinomadura viridis]|uniref:glycosyltransferase family 4 protein n=1 Tax=Actinomadura viridis TaxID=58110 RepID=UPI0031EBD5C4